MDATSGELSLFVDALIAALSTLGGTMALVSGGLAAWAFFTKKSREDLANRVNLGIALGFPVGLALAIIVFKLTFTKAI